MFYLRPINSNKLEKRGFLLSLETPLASLRSSPELNRTLSHGPGK